MGLLDNLIKMTAGAPKATESNQNAITSIMDILNGSHVGGLDGLVGKMSQGGLGNVVDSWIKTGKNKSVSSSQLSNVLGSDIIGQLASKLGVSNGAASGLLAKFLPLIVDKLTPDGKVTQQSRTTGIQDILGQILQKR